MYDLFVIYNLIICHFISTLGYRVTDIILWVFCSFEQIFEGYLKKINTSIIRNLCCIEYPVHFNQYYRGLLQFKYLKFHLTN